LDALVRLGANLEPDFTASELRTTFRRLARQFHPDRHPGSSDAEKARLSRLFTDLNDHHRLLRAVPDSARA
jgi:curved DNA-binding protein CbpA